MLALPSSLLLGRSKEIRAVEGSLASEMGLGAHSFNRVSLGWQRAPKATCRRPAPGRAPSACGNRSLHPARDAELRENLAERGLNARAPPRGRFLSRPHPPRDHRAASPAARRQK
ncbi:hypothetical protein H8959_019877 [Pygathrix nigripes]